MDKLKSFLSVKSIFKKPTLNYYYLNDSNPDLRSKFAICYLEGVKISKTLRNLVAQWLGSACPVIRRSCSLLHSHFLGCHATLTPKKRLLTSKQHSFPSFDQSQLSFHFREPCRAKFAILNLSNQRSCFISPSHGGTIGDNGDS